MASQWRSRKSEKCKVTSLNNILAKVNLNAICETMINNLIMKINMSSWVWPLLTDIRLKNISEV